MIENLDIQFGASTPGLGGGVGQVINSIRSVRDAVDSAAGFLDGFRAGMQDAFRAPPAGLEEGVRDAEEEIRDLRQEMERTERESRQLSSTMGGLGDSMGGIKRMAAGLLVGIGITEIARSTVETITSFEKLRATLATLEGEGVASTRFEALRKFAADTPYDVEQVVTSFTKLKAMGLDPGIEALTSYGNIASGMGKSLDQFIEAVADASSGEFERLKEFGIKSKQEGDSVTFTFQGVATTVKKTSTEIQDYLQKIGDTKFAGAMERQMGTIGGAFSNLGDNLAMIADQIGQGGLTQAITDAVSSMNEAGGTSENWAGILGGVLGSVLTVIVGIVKSLGETVSLVFSTIASVIRQVSGSTQSDGQIWHTVIAGIQLGIIGLGATIQITFTVIGGVLRTGVNLFVEAGQAIWRAMNFDFSGSVEAVRAWGAENVRIAQTTATELRRINADTNAAMKKASNIEPEKKAAAAELPGYKPPPPPAAAGDSDKGKGGKGQSVTQQWAEEYQRQQAMSGEFFRDQTAQELAFWQGKVDNTKRGSDDWYAVQQKIYTLSKQTAQRDYQDQIQMLSDRIRNERDNYAASAAAMDEKIALVRSKYGEESREYRNVLREQLEMQRTHQRELSEAALRGIQDRMRLSEEAAKTDLVIERSSLDQAEAMLADRENAGLIGRQEASARRAQIAQAEFSAQVALDERLYEMKVAGLREQLAVEGLRPQEIDRINRDIETAEAAHSQRVRVQQTQQAQLTTRANIDAATATRDVWMDRLRPVTQAFTGMVNGFLISTTSVRQAMLAVGSQLLQQVNGWVMDWVTRHVAAEQAKTAATVAGNAARTASSAGAAAAQAGLTAASATAEITTNAAVAGSGALAAVSKIPVIGPFIAPAIAAGILSLAMGFVSKIASAEGGWGQVPYDGAMTELHKDEMVLPASIASPLRDALSSKDSTWGLGSTGMAARRIPDEEMRGQPGVDMSMREGDTHIHVSALDTRSGVEWLQKNRREIGKSARRAYREGGR